MSPPLLFLTLFLLRLLHFPTPSFTQPSPAPPSAAFAPRRVLVLKDGLVSDSVRHVIELSAALPPASSSDLAAALDVSLSVTDGADTAAPKIDRVRVEYADAGNDPLHVIIHLDLTFNALPGLATVQLSLTEPTDPPREHPVRFAFHVIGVALYQPVADHRSILSGKSAPPLQLPPADHPTRTLTVNASVYASTGVEVPDTESLDLNALTFSVPDIQGPSPLPWDKDSCRVFNHPDNLDDLCAMAFSPDFSTFSLRVPEGRDLESSVKLVFSWTGLKEIAEAGQGDEGGLWGGDPSDPLQNDQITIARVDPNEMQDSQGGRALPAWKIAVILVTVILLVIAAITLVYCCFRRRKSSAPKKPRPFVRSVEHRIHQLGIQRVRFGSGENDDKCFVEEPSSHEDSTILMLENEPGACGGGGVAAGLVPPETTPSKELSAARLVLPREVMRGVDLEPSTEGGSMKFPLSGNDVTSYGRGMTSVPKDMYRHDEVESDGEDGPAPIARSAGQLRILTTVVHITEDRAGEAEEAVGRSGVGAAINRVRQVDLLNGPHSNGLVGRNGEPIRQPEAPDGSGKVLTLSTVS